MYTTFRTKVPLWQIWRAPFRTTAHLHVNIKIWLEVINVKKEYEIIEIEMIDIKLNDVIATSNPFDGEEQPFMVF